MHNRPWQSSQGKREAPDSLDYALSTLLTLIKELSFRRRFKECNLVGSRAVIPEWTCACAEGAPDQKTPCAMQTIFLVEQATDFNPFQVPVCGALRPRSSRRYPAVCLLGILRACVLGLEVAMIFFSSMPSTCLSFFFFLF